MKKMYTCPQGHQWEAPENETDPSCPHCTPTVLIQARPPEPTVGMPPPLHPNRDRTRADLSETNPIRVTIPGYELHGELGRGGMGVVYKAKDLQLNRLVALKMILAGGHAGPQHLTRFHTEAEAAARLHHPHIVQIYEIGEVVGDSGVVHPYMALEFCPGGSLAEHLDGTPVGPRDAARLVETLARAMEYAHAQGIVHRDLKPANVLLSGLPPTHHEGREVSSCDQRVSDARQVPKITDFGLAKLLQPDSAIPPKSADPTASGAVMGTPSYMAPEQADGKRRAIGPTTDVYALGAILYELLTGRPPFRATTPLDTVMQVINEDPVPLRRLQPSVPVDLETVCLKCLQKEPRKRYSFAGELAEDLRRWQHSEPIRARRITAVGRLIRWCRRNPLLSAVSAASVLLLLALSGLYAVNLHLQVSETRRALESERIARSETRRALDSEKTARGELSLQHERAEDALARSLYEQARAVRQSGESGRQWRMLELLERAARLRNRDRSRTSDFMGPPEDSATLPTPAELRSEAIAALLTPDARASTLSPVGTLGCALSGDGSRAVTLWLDEGRRAAGVRYCDLQNNEVISEIPSLALMSGRYALNGDGRLLASARAGRFIDLLAMPSGKRQRTLRPAPRLAPLTLTAQTHFAFSADQQYLAVAWSSEESSDLMIWKLKGDGEEPMVQSRIAGAVHGLAALDDERVLYIHGTNELSILDVNTGKTITQSLPLRLASAGTRGLNLPQQRLSCHAASSLAAFGCRTDDRKGVIVLWNFATSTEVRRLTGEFSADGFPVAFSPDGRLLAAGLADGSIECRLVHDVGLPIRLGRVHLEGVGMLGWNQEGHLLSGGKLMGVLHDWQLSEPAVRTNATEIVGDPVDVSLSAVGDWLALVTSGPRPEVCLLRRGSMKVAWRVPLTEAPSTNARLLFRPDAANLALLDARQALVWETATGKQVLSRQPEEMRRSRWIPGAYLDSGQLLAATPGRNGDVEVWDLFGGRVVHQAPASRGAARAHLTSDGRYLLFLPPAFTSLIPAAGPIVVWDLQQNKRIDGGIVGRDVFWARLGAQGKTFAWLDVPRTDGSVGLPSETYVSIKCLTEDRPLLRIPTSVLATSAAFSADGQLLALGLNNGMVQVHDAETGEELLRWPAHTRSVRLLEFAPDGESLISSEGVDVQLLDLKRMRTRLASMGLDW